LLLGVLIALAVGIVTSPAALPAGASSPPAPSTTTPANPPARAELLVDLDTGRALFARNDHTPLPPGSLTKILTALIAYAWLPHNSFIPVGALAANVTPERIGMEPGQKWPFEEVLQAALVFSANDASYALAQRISGSLGRFAILMTYAAAQIGLKDHPVLRDPAGLDGTEGFEGGNLISAWDTAVIARDLMANPQLAAIVGLRKLGFKGPNGTVYGLDNQNLFFLSTYPGAVGVKTGLTDRAGFCVVEEAVRAPRHMLAVVLNGTNSYQSAAFLLNLGFATAARAEPRKDPALPPPATPEPPPASPPSPPATYRHLSDEQASDGAGVVADSPARAAPVSSETSATSDEVVAGAAAALAVAVLLAVWVLWVSPRRRPGGGPSQRR
jgi:D-alanyl-D-alanine carboxypeptidase (penicillin-binding protein 5/6)